MIMSEYQSFDKLLKDAIVRLDKRIKKANPEKYQSQAHNNFQQNMRELFNDNQMFKRGEE